METVLVISVTAIMAILFVALILYHNFFRCPHCHRWFRYSKLLRSKWVDDRVYIFYHCPYCHRRVKVVKYSEIDNHKYGL